MNFSLKTFFDTFSYVENVLKFHEAFLNNFRSIHHVQFLLMAVLESISLVSRVLDNSVCRQNLHVLMMQI
jgi:hypothetical protein